MSLVGQSLVRDKTAHGGAAVPHAEIDALQLRVECAVVQTCQWHSRTFIFLGRPVTKNRGQVTITTVAWTGLSIAPNFGSENFLSGSLRPASGAALAAVHSAPKPCQ